MEILMISHEYPPIGGGGANACMFLSREYAKRGHKVTIVTANFQRNLPRDTVDSGVRIVRVHSKRENREHCGFSEMMDFIFKAWKPIRKLQKENQFDVCQVFFGIPSGPLGYVLKKRYHVPYIIRFGGGDIPGFQDRFTKVYKLIAPCIRSIWKNADYLVANSAGLRDLALEFDSRYDIAVIPNGVDTDFYKPGEGRSKDEIRILFVSRLIERKGLQYILPDWKRIVTECNRRVTLTIVGDGPYRHVLERIVQENELDAYISFVGQKEKSELCMFYEQADVFILPSAKEGMPNVVLEAMAAGLPIVMTPCQGSKELVCDNGIIAEISEFSDAIIRLCNEENLRMEQGQNSRKRAASYFSWGNTAESYLQYMEEV